MIACMWSAKARRVVAVIGGSMSGGGLAKGYELANGTAELAFPFLLVGLGVGLMVAALVRD